MTINLVRVINEQTILPGLSRNGSILIDKIDKSQGNSDSPPYAQIAKQQIYVPFANPVDPSVKGYTDFVPTDEVLLAAELDGSIGGLATTVPPRVTVATVASNLIATPTVSAANHTDPVVVAGTTFLSIAPDITYAELTNNVSGAVQIIPSSAFTGGAPDSGVQLRIPFASVSIGTPAAGWLIRVLANSRWSNQFTLT